MTSETIRPELPESLKQRRLRNILLRSISCFALFVFALVSIILWGEAIFPFPTQNASSLRYVCYGLFLLLPFLLTGVPLKLIDKVFSGTIRKAEIKDTIHYGSGGSQKNSGSCIQSDLILTVETDDGKIIKYNRLSFRTPLNRFSIENTRPGNVEHHKHEFREGERIYKYYGIKYPYIAHPTLPDDKYCIVCGQKNENKESFCFSCGAELVEQKT